MHTDRSGNTRRQKCCAKGSGKEVKIQEFMYRDKTNVEPEMYNYTGNNWSHWNRNEKFKEKCGSCTRKTFDRFTTKDSYTWNITHNTEKVLQCEAWSLSSGDHRWFKRSTRKKSLWQETSISYSSSSSSNNNTNNTNINERHTQTSMWTWRCDNAMEPRQIGQI